MDIGLLHPRNQIARIMMRIYGYGMTTTSGGNLSIRDRNGDIWISPKGVDKGSLRPEDIVCVKPDGTSIGIHEPSLELPFHKAIYAARPDAGAVIHAHPAALVTFSIARKIPDTSILPKARQICGEVGCASYARPGSEELGRNVAVVFAAGSNAVLLENHGTVICGSDLFETFMRFETLDFCARLIIKANILGKAAALTDEELSLSREAYHLLPEFVPDYHSSHELELRGRMISLLHRAYDQKLVTSTEGTFSVRVDEESFLITPYGMDRRYLDLGDLVYIKRKQRERGKVPSRSVLLHESIYKMHSDVNGVVIAHPPNIMAFAVSHTAFDSLTIPEAYLFLRDMPALPYGAQYREREKVAEMLGPETPVLLVNNDCVISIGNSLLQAFDRLEIAEFSAEALLASKNIGPPVHISDEEREDLERTFF